MGYRNFKLAIYCPVGDLNGIKNINEFDKSFSFIEKYLQPDKVYLETFRNSVTIEKDKLLLIKNYFQSKGIKTSGGITTSLETTEAFRSMCYTNEEDIKTLKDIVVYTANIFDEIILDDFYFTNCKCSSCIDAKGNSNWAEFRTELMKHISADCIIKPAKEVNSDINLIIKYPNWYEHYQETGYNLKDESLLFDMIYTGTETRDPQHTQQHLPRYLSYFIMRYLENVKPGKNGGGWFDPYQCSYNTASYADQALLTLLGKSREVTLFCLGSLLNRYYSIFVPIAGYIFDTVDEFIGSLGNPTGTACYLPYHSCGEDYLHNYIGMLGIPLEPYPELNLAYNNIFLTKNAAFDKDIVSKIKNMLLSGKNVIITTGLLKAVQDSGFDTIANIRCTDRRAYVNKFAISDYGVVFNKMAFSEKPVLIPQLDYSTNDSWQLVSGLGCENNFPILTKNSYGKGSLYILTIPDDFGDLYYYPAEVLYPIRAAFSHNSDILIDTVSKVSLFTYDNGIFVIKSFLPFTQEVAITVNKPGVCLNDLVSGEQIKGLQCGNKTIFNVQIAPMSYRVYKETEVY